MTDDLVVGAFSKAMRNRCLDNDGLFHSDRGSQHTSNKFEHLLEELGINIHIAKRDIPMIMQVCKASRPY